MTEKELSVLKDFVEKEPKLKEVINLIYNTYPKASVYAVPLFDGDKDIMLICDIDISTDDLVGTIVNVLPNYTEYGADIGKYPIVISLAEDNTTGDGLWFIDKECLNG